jgi:uncharacterized protein (TIGR03435 family)
MIPHILRKAPGKALACCLILASVALPAQSPATSPPPVPQLSFDVVSIRQNTSGSREMKRQSAADTDEIAMTNVPLAVVVYYAYGINNENLLTGVPQWAFTERYDVVAKVAPSDLPAYHALTSRQRAAMLQKVLADRCKLQAHHETKDKPVYALVVAKNGPRLKQALPGEVHPNAAKADPSGMVHGATIFATGPGQLTAEAASMTDLALALSNSYADLLGRLVVDRTGLTAKYDFTLQPDPSQTGPSTTPDDQQQPVDARQQALFSALGQLGLKLKSATAPTEYLIIDQIEKPSGN